MDRRTFLLGLTGLPLLAHAADASSEAFTSFAPVLPGRALVFPDDYGAHPDFRTEWWYATGWLTLPDGSPLGFQSTFFRVRTGIGENNPSAFAPRQLILAHAAIADPALGRLRHDQRSARVGFGRAGAEVGPTKVWVGDWSLTLDGSRYQAEVKGADFAYSLSLQTDAPPMCNGDAGFSAKAPDGRHASYYYSRPQLAVRGSVTLGGRQQPVTGRAWLDHEWSSQLMPTGARGWDWVGLNFDDGSALMAFRMRAQDSTALLANASLRGSDELLEVYESAVIHFVPLRHWRSPRTGIDYPVEWQLQVGERDYRLQTLFDDQELDSRLSTGAIYWEGAVRVFAHDQEVGRGYLEMTGYGETLRIG